MKSRRAPLFLSAAAIAVLASCKSTSVLSPEQRLTTAPTTIKEDAYHAPKSLVKYEMGRKVGGMIGGLLPLMIGHAVDASRAEAVQDRLDASVEDRLHDSHPAAALMVANRVDQLIQQTIENLRRQPAGGETASQLRAEIIKYGLFLSRTDDEGTPILGASVGIKVYIEPPDGPKRQVTELFGYSDNYFRLSQYEADPDLLDQVFAEAVTDMALPLRQALRGR